MFRALWVWRVGPGVNRPVSPFPRAGAGPRHAREQWCHTHLRPPSCREGQRLSRKPRGSGGLSPHHQRLQPLLSPGWAVLCQLGGVASCNSSWPGPPHRLGGRADASQRPPSLQLRSCSSSSSRNKGRVEASDALGSELGDLAPSLHLICPVAGRGLSIGSGLPC